MKLSPLLQEEKWEEIVLLGEKALQEDISSSEKFTILDQLISCYFRLGLFDEAKERAGELVILGELLNQPHSVVDSFYKLSVALRGAADSEKDPVKKRQLFSECYSAIEKAFTICEERCGENKALRSRVLFNRGAVCCDDPMGDVHLGISCYKEAISLFKELNEIDYTQRMLIRLGKAYFLVRDFKQSRQMIEELKAESLEKRTWMQLLYLEAQVCLEEKNRERALEVALQGKEIAISLHAQHDISRFETFIKKIQ
ncbi:MAG: hypothetical protein V4489_04690 [Chlamydiota bacterium]